MAGVVGLSNGPAADWLALAGIVAFETTGVIDARNGGAYAAAATIPYSAGTTYHFRLDIDIPSHTYDIYVTPAGAPEQLLGRGFAFRTEQAAVSLLTHPCLYAAPGSPTHPNHAMTLAPSTSAGTWQNGAIPSQTAAFEAQFDATPTAANMAGVVGLSNGPAADWTALAGIVAFETTGVIDARNGGTYAAAATIPYSAGTTYHFRLDIDIPSHTYDIYVTPAGAPEQLLGRGFAFRTEQATVSVLNNLGLYAAAGSATVSNLTIATSTPPAPVAAVTVSPATTSGQVGATVQLAAVTKDSDGNTLTGRSVTWASNAPGMATVSASGLVTSVASGAATITATSEGQSGTAAISVAAANCQTSAGTWQNSAIPSQTAAFEAQFDATPTAANMAGVVGLSNGHAADWTALAGIVAFETTGVIDARNGGTYAAAATIPYSAGTTHHFRLDVDIPSYTYHR